MEVSERWITNARGHKLYVKIYQGRDSKGVLVFHHGYAAHCSLYDDVFKDWATKGINVVAHDSQGYGRSRGDNPQLHAYMDNFQHWVDDVYQVRKEVADSLQPAGQQLPVFMGGISMGGCLTILTALRNQSAWQGIVLVSPAVDAQRNLLLDFLALLQHIALLICPRARIVPSPPFEKCTNVPALIEQFKADPLMDHGEMRVKTGKAFLDAFKIATNKAKELTLPILVVASKSDQVISVPAIDKFVKDVQSKDLTAHWVDSGFHELLLGPSQTETSNACLDWFSKHV